MKKDLLKFAFVGVATLGLQIGIHAQSAFEVVANNEVPVTSLDKNALKDILVGKTTYWTGGQAVTIVVLAEKTDSALQDVTGMSSSQFKTHWQRIMFSGRGQQPKQADSEDKLISQVAATKGAVALVPAGTPANGVKKIELK